MIDNQFEKAWSKWQEEDLDLLSFEIGYNAGIMAERRFTIFKGVVLPFFIGGITAALMISWMVN